VARRLDNQREVDTQRVGNFEMYDFPADSVAFSMNALRARDLMAYSNTLTSPQCGGRRDKIPMTLVAPSESILSFPSRFGSNANVTEGQAQSMAHSAGAPAVFRKSARAQTNEDSETWVEGDVANTLNSFDVGDVRTTHAILSPSLHGKAMGGGGDIGQDEAVAQVFAALGGSNEVAEDALLPVGLDSHRYRCCGNGVVAPVAEWIGRRIVEVDRRWREEGK
jgi:site-specific DNA-cytosine methylase